MGRILPPFPYRGPAFGRGREGGQDGPAGPTAGPVADRRGRRPDGPGGAGRQIGPVEPAAVRTSRRQVEDSRRTSARSAPERSTAASTRARQKRLMAGPQQVGDRGSRPRRTARSIRSTARRRQGFGPHPTSAARMRGSGRSGGHRGDRRKPWARGVRCHHLDGMPPGSPGSARGTTWSRSRLDVKGRRPTAG